MDAFGASSSFFLVLALILNLIVAIDSSEHLKNETFTIISYRNANIAEYASYSARLNKYYCDCKGYRYLDFNESSVGTMANIRDIRWIKIWLLQNAVRSILQSTDKNSEDHYVVWIDADMVVSDFSISFGPFTESFPYADLLASRDSKRELGLINTGLIIVKATQWSDNFLTRWWNSYDKDSLSDQGAFTAMWQSNFDAIQSKAILLPPSALNSDFPIWEKFLDGESKFIHLAGEYNSLRALIFSSMVSRFELKVRKEHFFNDCHIFSIKRDLIIHLRHEHAVETIQTALHELKNFMSLLHPLSDSIAIDELVTLSEIIRVKVQHSLNMDFLGSNFHVNVFELLSNFWLENQDTKLLSCIDENDMRFNLVSTIYLSLLDGYLSICDSLNAMSFNRRVIIVQEIFEILFELLRHNHLNQGCKSYILHHRLNSTSPLSWINAILDNDFRNVNHFNPKISTKFLYLSFKYLEVSVFTSLQTLDSIEMDRDSGQVDSTLQSVTSMVIQSMEIMRSINGINELSLGNHTILAIVNTLDSVTPMNLLPSKTEEICSSLLESTRNLSKDILDELANLLSGSAWYMCSKGKHSAWKSIGRRLGQTCVEIAEKAWIQGTSEVSVIPNDNVVHLQHEMSVLDLCE